jgi:hypothetical protein
MRSLKKYKNPDKRCTYPFADNALGYCWSYACYVDGERAFEYIEKICKGCEYWNGKKGETKKHSVRKQRPLSCLKKGISCQKKR